MGRKSIEERIKEAEEKLASEKERLSKLRAQKKQEERKKDTRRKVLLGAMLMEWMENEKTREAVKNKMEEFLKREKDKELFDEKWFQNKYGP